MTLKQETDDTAQLLENMAVDVLVSGKVNLPSSLDKAIDSITLDAVNKVRMLSWSLLCYSVWLCRLRNV